MLVITGFTRRLKENIVFNLNELGNKIEVTITDGSKILKFTYIKNIKFSSYINYSYIDGEGVNSYGVSFEALKLEETEKEK